MGATNILPITAISARYDLSTNDWIELGRYKKGDSNGWFSLGVFSYESDEPEQIMVTLQDGRILKTTAFLHCNNAVSRDDKGENMFGYHQREEWLTSDGNADAAINKAICWCTFREVAGFTANITLPLALVLDKDEDVDDGTHAVSKFALLIFGDDGPSTSIPRYDVRCRVIEL